MLRASRCTFCIAGSASSLEKEGTSSASAEMIHDSLLMPSTASFNLRSVAPRRIASLAVRSKRIGENALNDPATLAQLGRSLFASRTTTQMAIRSDFMHMKGRGFNQDTWLWLSVSEHQGSGNGSWSRLKRIGLPAIGRSEAVFHAASIPLNSRIGRMLQKESCSSEAQVLWACPKVGLMMPLSRRSIASPYSPFSTWRKYAPLFGWK